MSHAEAPAADPVTGPDSTAAPRRSPVTLRLLALVLGVVAILGAGALGQRHALGLFLDDTARRGDTTLRLAVATLRGHLARYERLPALIAEQDLVRALARDSDDPALIVAANLYLRDIARLLDVSDIYLMDPGGTTRAASNFDTATSFVGGNFAFRPYFSDAITGGAGRFFALGTTSLKRGYYFGAPVRDDAAAVRGVLVFKIDLDAIEDAWRGGDDEIIVTDPEGIIFLASRRDWLFSALEPLSAPRRAQTEATRRYAGETIGTLPLSITAQGDGRQLATLTEPGAARRYLKLSEPMAEADWVVSVMLDTTVAERQARTAAVVVMLGLGLGSMALAVLVQRRARLRERLQMQQAARDALEGRVAERTAQLASVNDRLEAEVAERRATEQELRQAQADLVQAAKLAALGQMSAALSHEFNQPLGAARTYADNALVLMDRDRLPEARGNIARILDLIDRMAAISRHLRSFARKPGQRLGPVELAVELAAAQEIAGPRLRAAGVTLLADLPPDLPQVIAGPVRLQQVLVNLLTNAADAVETVPDRRLHLTASPQPGGMLRICLRDHGPGVPPGLAQRIFDPFFSTKGVGKGLGLGLSISYNIVKDFGGDLTVRDAPGGGAEFVLDLRAAAAGDIAA